ncbi:AI-2E family transporter [Deinococcus sp.]|uniref:AI-2E family transporter n=1 Tax=Deinococcus sp. TaxID=47478 RepID=UPI0025BC80CA|nr:AI-2E family transporter [Deinococcus sp.]
MNVPPSPGSTQRPARPDWRDARDVPQLLQILWAQPTVRLTAYLFLLLAAVWTLAWGSQLMASVIVTVIAAYGLAFLANPLLSWLERHRVSRMVGVMLLLSVTIALTTLLVMTVSSQVTGLINGIPELARNLKGITSSVLDRLDSVKGAEGIKESLSKYIDEQINNLTTNTGPLLERLVNAGPDVLGTLSSLVGWLGQLGFIVTLAMYFMLDYDRAGRSVLKVFPRRWQPTLLRLSDDVSGSFGGFLRGQLLLMLSTAVLATAGLMALRVPNALALGLLSGLLSLVPYVGIVVAAAVPMLLAATQGALTVGLVAALYFFINQIQGNVLGPLIMGRTMHLSPAAILIALLVGLSIAGVPGAVLAIPLATLFKRWLKRYWLTTRAYRGDSIDATQ